MGSLIKKLFKKSLAGSLAALAGNPSRPPVWRHKSVRDTFFLLRPGNNRSTPWATPEPSQAALAAKH